MKTRAEEYHSVHWDPANAERMMSGAPARTLNVVMAGGGVRLSAYVGALAALEDLGWGIRSVAGASGGSIVASFLSIGWSTSEMLRCLLETDFARFKDFSLRSLVFEGSLYSGRRFEGWLDRELGGARFRDLHGALHVAALDLITRQPFLFSTSTTPDAPLSTAVRCSMSIPGVWCPGRWKGKVLVDGMLSEWVPVALELLAKDHEPDESARTVILRVISDDTRQKATTPQVRPWLLAQLVLESLMSSLENTRVPGEVWRQTVLIRVDGISPLRLGLTPPDKERLFQAGYDQTRRYFRERVEASDPVAQRDDARSLG
jgi:NTE family protein